MSPAEFRALDDAFHVAYRAGLAGCRLAADAWRRSRAWTGTQSLLSMFFHDELVPVVTRHGLLAHLRRVDGLRDAVGGGPKAPHLRAHLAALAVDPADCVLIGDSVDDADAAARGRRPGGALRGRVHRRATPAGHRRPGGRRRWWRRSRSARADGPVTSVGR